MVPQRAERCSSSRFTKKGGSQRDCELRGHTRSQRGQIQIFDIWFSGRSRPTTSLPCFEDRTAISLRVSSNHS